MREKIKSLLTKKTLVCWGISTLIMFSFSYLWHGVVLNDFMRIDYPKSIFLTLFAFLYIMLGLIMSLIYAAFHAGKRPIHFGMLIGSIIGFGVFLVSFVLGVSFSETVALSYVAIDCTWQTLEQLIGGGAIGLVYSFLTLHERVID